MIGSWPGVGAEIVVAIEEEGHYSPLRGRRRASSFDSALLERHCGGAPVHVIELIYEGCMDNRRGVWTMDEVYG